jgi:signal transduction histidine kinase
MDRSEGVPVLANGDTGDQAPLHILLVEDDPGDALLTQTLVRRAGLNTLWSVAARLSDVDFGLLDSWADCVLVDLDLPDCDGLEAVGTIQRRAPRLPVVVVSGNHDRDLALRAVHAGAQDYLIKGRVDADQLAKTVRYAIERKRIEHALRQAQQLATLGRLTGGIAHNFNNLLGVVLNYTDFVAEALRGPPSEATWREAREDVQHIQRATRRAAALIRQLTVFAEQDTVRAQVIQLNDVISGSQERLAARLRAGTTLDTELGTGLDPIRADRGHLELLLASLTDNAAEAMPSGGTLAIRTALVPGAAPRGMADGRYVRLRVADTGSGIPPDILGSIFDPFFSTKPPGSSAGLGLTVARAITSRWGGRITLDSAPGTGTTVTVLFPAAQDRNGAGDQAGTGDTEAR